MASRTSPGPATLGLLETGIRCFREGGFSVPSALPFEMTIEHVLQPGYAYGKEFDSGLTVILNGVAALRKPWASPRLSSHPPWPICAIAHKTASRQHIGLFQSALNCVNPAE